jgi:hypothetical protein
MCRSIKILRTPYTVGATDDDMRAAALQYVQAVCGYRIPPPENADAFNEAVATLTAMTRDLVAAVESGAGGARVGDSGRRGLTLNGRHAAALPNT